jgi:3-oxoacyl-[acyl-carrier protein] reductase
MPYRGHLGRGGVAPKLTGATAALPPYTEAVLRSRRRTLTHDGSFMTHRLEGTVAIVTGGSRGIGRAIALRLAGEGAAVAVSFHSSPEKARETIADIGAMGGEAIALPCDVARAEAVREFTARVMEEYGRVDILVNNAGVTRDTLISRMSEEDWDAVIGTNLTGAFHFCRAVVPSMITEGHGKIINVGSIVAVSGNPGQANYVASKAGLIGLTKALARELASKNIQVNVVAPGFTETDMTAQLSTRQVEAILRFGTKRGIARPEQIAGFAAFLASSDSDLITGQTFIAEATFTQWEREQQQKT